MMMMTSRAKNLGTPCWASPSVILLCSISLACKNNTTFERWHRTPRQVYRDQTHWHWQIRLRTFRLCQYPAMIVLTMSDRLATSRTLN